MKRSNIIIMITAILTISWLLLSGWMQSKAYRIIQSGKTCSYAVAAGRENIIQLQAFKNIKVEIGKHSDPPFVFIQYAEKNEMTYTNDLKEAISETISRDTLYLNVKNGKLNSNAVININVQKLNSLFMSSTTENDVNYKENSVSTIISGFNANSLYIKNNGANYLRIEKNKLHKLELNGNFYMGGKVKISQYPDYDSIKLDIEGKNGSLIMGFRENERTKRNPNQWIDIKLPATFHVDADVSVTNRISLRK
ncbi:MAG: hypothetical protein HXX14_09885 [Bacteroidetes bacterium]|nr:hypothetical protein [Bacteroidota bacterium]